MSNSSGLVRKIAIYMSVVTTLGLTISTVGSYRIYGWVFAQDPEFFDTPVWQMTPFDVFMLFCFIVFSICLSVAAAALLSRRIARPLTSLATAARHIKNGDLSARASSDDRSFSEATEMVENFNDMADRLQNAAEDLMVWNAAIAHELRTPVTILLGRLQGVSDGLFELDDALLAGLIAQTESLARLIEDLRVVSLADSGHLHLRYESVDLHEVVDGLRITVEPTLSEAGFNVLWRTQSVTLHCDPMRIRQAVLALIDNARKHATPGLLRISVKERADQAVIKVSDIGPGLRPSTAQQLFSPFVRGNARRDGTGLGLSVVHAIADAHGGSLKWHPSVDGGSSFELALPMHPSPKPSL